MQEVKFQEYVQNFGKKHISAIKFLQPVDFNEHFPQKNEGMCIVASCDTI